MQQYIDVEEFARLSGKTESYIRRLCREQKLPYIQEQVPQSGRHKYLIDTESEKSKKFLLPEPVPNQFEKLPEQEPKQNFTNTDTVSELLEAKDKIIELQDHLIQTKEIVGQVNLLTTLDKNKDAEINKLNARVKELEIKLYKIPVVIRKMCGINEI